MTQKTKKKILDALEGIKEFEVSWQEEVGYSVYVKAKSIEEATEMFWDGKIKPTDNDITDCDVMDNSLEVTEVNL